MVNLKHRKNEERSGLIRHQVRRRGGEGLNIWCVPIYYDNMDTSLLSKYREVPPALVNINHLKNTKKVGDNW